MQKETKKSTVWHLTLNNDFFLQFKEQFDANFCSLPVKSSSLVMFASLQALALYCGFMWIFWHISGRCRQLMPEKILHKTPVESLLTGIIGS